MNNKMIFFLISTVTFNVFSSQEKPNNKPQGEIKISIENNMGIDLINARFNLNNTESWSDIGIISKGINSYIIQDRLSDSPSILQAMEPNGQWISAIVKKRNPSTINIIISSDSKDEILKAWDLEAKKGSIPAKISSILDKKTEVDIFFPREKKYTNEWASTCVGGAVAVGVMSCEIASTPSMTFTGWGGGIGLFTAIYGGWASDLSRNELVGRSDTWRIKAFGYVVLTMGKHSTFKGGGLGAGFTGGDGHLGGSPPPKPPTPPAEPFLVGVMIESLSFPGQCITKSNSNNNLTLTDCNQDDNNQRWSQDNISKRIFSEGENARCWTMEYPEQSGYYVVSMYLSSCANEISQNDWVFNGTDFTRFLHWDIMRLASPYGHGAKLSMFSYYNPDEEIYENWKLINHTGDTVMSKIGKRY